MSKIYYELGLTDEDSEFFVRTTQNSQDRVEYNLRRQQPKLEKAVLVWELLDSPVTRGILDAWEQIIRSPHLLMTHNQRSPTYLNPDFNDYRVSWEYIPLVPLKDLEYYELTLEDAEQIETNAHNQFGALYLNYNYSVARHSPNYQTSWRRAVQDQKLTQLQEGPVRLLATPTFETNFVLRGLEAPRFEMDQGVKTWMQLKKAGLDRLGYYAQDPRCKVGNYRVGELVTDPNEAVAAIEKYRNPCRHSIVTEQVIENREKKVAN